ncbi:hypothetical protein GQ600_16077 [Phytophthora cactorum]|nr:hypothetical protein GQ600_16077 [Phytophthora cactorum]
MKADLMDQNLYLAIFMQNPTRDESQELFHAAQSHSGQNEKKKKTLGGSQSHEQPEHFQERQVPESTLYARILVDVYDCEVETRQILDSSTISLL